MASILALVIGAAVLATLIRVLHKARLSGKIALRIPHVALPGRQTSSPKKTTNIDYSDVFPPSRHDQLCRLFPNTSPAVPRVLSKNGVLKLEDNYEHADPASLLFTGFSVGEVRALGDFPDYATLSGVPLPSPRPDFNIEDAVPRPYRPFRWAYHQTMSFKKLEPDYWLELENTYKQRIVQRKELYEKHGKDVLQALPGSELACKELMEIALQFLCARYPHYFEIQGQTLVNRILDLREDLGTKEPLMVLLDNVPEDFAIMLRDHTTGRYIFRAGIICSSVGWNLGDKMGHGLPAIHGPVPDYKEKMEFSMDRFFTKMPCDSPIQRGSWGLEHGQPLYVPAGHPDLAVREKQDPALDKDDVFLRVDWQTVRRLPLSGGVVFNFKALFTSIAEFQDEPYIPTLLLKILNEASPKLMGYKGTWHVEHVAKPLFEEYERSQIESGMMEPDWEPRTLDEMPFFRGWEKKSY